MLPFPIISNTNIVPKRDIVKFSTVNASIYILYSTGELYGIGRNALYQIGTGDNVTVKNWYLMSTNVSNFWVSSFGDSPVIIKKKDNTWHMCGRAFIFGDTSTIYSTVQNVDSKLGVLNNGFDELYLNNQNIWYRKDGRYYRMGLNSYYHLLTGNTTSLTSFTEYVLPVGMKAIFPSLNGTIVSYTDGTMKAIGTNVSGAYGLPTRSEYTSLTTITVPEVYDVYYGENATFMRTVNGTYVCGSNDFGQLGNGLSDTNTYVLTPTLMSATNYDYLRNAKGCTIMYSTGTIKCSGAQYRTGNGLTTSTSFIPAPNILSTNFHMNNNCTYYILNNEIYGVGQVSVYSLLPGYSTNQYSFVKITLPY